MPSCVCCVSASITPGAISPLGESLIVSKINDEDGEQLIFNCIQKASGILCYSMFETDG